MAYNKKKKSALLQSILDILDHSKGFFLLLLAYDLVEQWEHLSF